MNLIQIAGHLGADPETRVTSSGKKVTTLRVGVRTRKDDTIWWRVTIWEDQFAKMMPYFKKGSAIIAYGELHKPEIYNDREGKPQVSMEMTAIDLRFSPFGKPGGAQEGSGHQAAAQTTQHAAPSPYMGARAGQGQTIDDEVPF